MSILIADDSRDARCVLELILVEAGYSDIVHADSGDRALDMLGSACKGVAQGEIDLILLDIRMPGKNGIDTCKLIKEMEPYEDTPVVMVTSMEDEKLLQSAFNAGAIEYLTKPFHRLELIARIRSILKYKEEMDRRATRERELLEWIEKLKAGFPVPSTGDYTEVMQAVITREIAVLGRDKVIRAISQTTLELNSNDIITGKDHAVEELEELMNALVKEFGPIAVMFCKIRVRQIIDANNLILPNIFQKSERIYC